jgi:hypothetical protein
MESRKRIARTIEGQQEHVEFTPDVVANEGNTDVKRIRKTIQGQQEDIQLEPLRPLEAVEPNQNSQPAQPPKALNFRYMRDKDREKVRGKFHFNECPGGTLSFSIRIHKGDPVETYNLVDGAIVTIPRGVAKHLNKNGWYPIHKHYSTEENKGSLIKVGQKVHRFSFQSLEFLDDDASEMDNRLLTVERVTPAFSM